MTNKRKGPPLERARAWWKRHSWPIDDGRFSNNRPRQQPRNHFLGPNITARNPLPPPGADWRERLRIAAQLIDFTRHSPYSEKIALLIHRLTSPDPGLGEVII